MTREFCNSQRVSPWCGAHALSLNPPLTLSQIFGEKLKAFAEAVPMFTAIESQ